MRRRPSASAPGRCVRSSRDPHLAPECASTGDSHSLLICSSPHLSNALNQIVLSACNFWPTLTGLWLRAGLTAVAR